MSDDVMEEELLRSIDEVDAKLHDFRKRVQAVLSDLQGNGETEAPRGDRGAAT